MTDQDQRKRAIKKPELTDADKALLEAEPDWERMGQGARRLLSPAPETERNHVAIAGKRLERPKRHRD